LRPRLLVKKMKFELKSNYACCYNTMLDQMRRGAKGSIGLENEALIEDKSSLNK
jgi:hypothetical protein